MLCCCSETRSSHPHTGERSSGYFQEALFRTLAAVRRQCETSQALSQEICRQNFALQNGVRSAVMADDGFQAAPVTCHRSSNHFAYQISESFRNVCNVVRLCDRYKKSAGMRERSCPSLHEQACINIFRFLERHDMSRAKLQGRVVAHCCKVEKQAPGYRFQRVGRGGRCTARCSSPRSTSRNRGKKCAAPQGLRDATRDKTLDVARAF